MDVAVDRPKIGKIPKVLVIDDTPANLIAMKVLLKELDTSVITSESGNQGLAMALEDDIALILLDVNMPEMDGFEVARLLKDIEETSSIPIIFLTAFHQNEINRLEGYNSGAIDYIEKPIHPQVLLAKTNIFLDIWRTNNGMEEEINRRIRVEKEIEYLAQHDALTHLINRRQLNIELDKSINRAKRTNSRLAVLFMDLDGFKRINDEFGHEAGDEFLKVVASRFSESVRNFDIVARYGGDEFIIILNDINQSIALSNKLQILIENASQPVEWQGKELKGGVSIGVAVYPEHSDQSDQLVSQADQAMYMAKEVGKNTFRYFSEEMNNTLLRRVLLENKLQSALPNCEMSLFYQPIVDIKTGHVAGAEGLLRWNNHELGEIRPDEFIAIAEGNNSINELGLWVLESAIAMMDNCQDLIISINASALQLKNDDLNKALEKYSGCTSFSRNQLCVEITEGLLLEETESVQERLNNIREMGIDLAVDDFGTGYSSLSYLRSCPVNKLKIDRSFVSEIPHDKSSNALVRAIIMMARALDLKVIAEGIETEEQWEFLKQEGCDYGQGYYFSRPLQADQFLKYLNNDSEYQG